MGKTFPRAGRTVAGRRGPRGPLRDAASVLARSRNLLRVKDVRHREAVYRTMGEYIRGVHPVCTGLVVVALARPEWLVEIDATAVIPDEEVVT